MLTYSTKAWAKDSMFSLSRLVVGSSSARIPQFRQNVSAKASRMMSEAKTCKIIHTMKEKNGLTKQATY